ncbi:DNA topoisomerase III [Aeromonas caviae]|uniref:DNA topoisomerase III n=1 Tax=Aeromonas caviae TaxID=648 RepID=UPI0018A59F59|nr:DNA topoisomerase III [Aeromonas caviae]MDH1400079.1 DNA topoisomerase III [Aeromonas caviae]BCM78171.1 DNA topoisomerase III [Aeromonas caviae]GJA15507.1 DNA topoisomerase III [Aeromonas caviae]GJA25507.1 DNA topoisomerase III [Aeromonas caviae]GJC24231.1 DNA topoisomerase III [Aeromonas caviae]
MRLFIAEKPSVAKAIASELGQTGKGDGWIQCGSDKITWCFGHMLELAEPDEYTPDDVPRNDKGKKIWRVEELPIVPSEWILQPKDDAKAQLNTIGRLLKEATVIVNAGDPDREGQLLVDEVLEHFGCHKPVQRFWVSAQDSVSVRRGLDALKDNATYRGWADAAKGRSRADWLIGMNLSRAYTLRAQRGGSRSLLTIGRVQTPTLNLVVMRDREIEAFKPIPYHKIAAEIRHAGGSFIAAWNPREDQAGLDAEGRLTDTAIANSLVEKVTGQAGSIVGYEQTAKKSAHPLAFALSDITLLASNKFGYSAEEVLNVCQSLYETHKLTSYPRTDCPYLPESQHADAPRVLAALKVVNPELASVIDKGDVSIKSKTWNDSKITAHHGIIPTMHQGNKAALNEKERAIYDLIVRAYIAQFYPLHEFLSTGVEVLVADERFTANGKVITKNGWHDVFQAEEEEDKDKEEESKSQKLPPMKNGDNVTCIQAQRKDAKTRAPAPFTEGTLIRAMENIHRFVTDPQHKQLLRDGDGIGTSATRAAVISDLKRRTFLEVKGKQIRSTPLGRGMIDALPEVVKSPVLTAIFERTLKGVEEGKASLDDFIQKQVAFVTNEVTKANNGAVKVGGEKTPTISVYKCKACGKGLCKRPGKTKGSFWWGCSGYPDCKQTYPDVGGKPNYVVRK